MLDSVKAIERTFGLPYLAIVELAIKQQKHNVKNAERMYNYKTNASSLIWLECENNVLRKLYEIRKNILGGHSDEQIENS